MSRQGVASTGTGEGLHRFANGGPIARDAKGACSDPAGLGGSQVFRARPLAGNRSGIATLYCGPAQTYTWYKRTWYKRDSEHDRVSE